jgi:segregation and condensation protein A
VEPTTADRTADSSGAPTEQTTAKMAESHGEAGGEAAAADAAPTGAEGEAAKTPSDGEPAEEVIDPDAYRVKLDVFEGPLDLLLHLIRKHELDILDIPVSFITEKYLEYLKLMEEVQIDVASEYLVMAATLTHIKSKMLLPAEPSDQEDEDGEAEFIDPRAELVRRLLEYQKYKQAAEQLGSRSALGRDVFQRGNAEPVPEGPAPLAGGNVFKLFDAFSKVLERSHREADHQVLFERVSIAERIVELTEMLHDHGQMRFDDLFVITDADGNPREPTRLELVVTFLALLEMCKMRIARVLQPDPLGEIELELAAKRVEESGSSEPPLDEDAVLPPDADPWQQEDETDSFVGGTDQEDR